MQSRVEAEGFGAKLSSASMWEIVRFGAYVVAHQQSLM